MSIIYEVTLHVDADIAEEYDAWLEQHIREMHVLPGFVGSEKFSIETEQEAPSQVGRVVHYRLESCQAFDDYLRDHVDRMRDKGVERFGDRFSASRRILHPM